MANILDDVKSALDNAAYFQSIREQMAMLEEGKILALKKDPNALIVGKQLPTRGAELEKTNLDKGLLNAINSLKSPEQVKVEELLFGQQVGSRKPPKIANAEEYAEAFENYDWPAIIMAYDKEYKALEEILALEKSFLNRSKSGQSSKTETQSPSEASPEATETPSAEAPSEPPPTQPPATDGTPPPATAPSGEPPQLTPDQEEYNRLYNQYYQDFLARGFAEPNAQEMAKRFVDAMMAVKQKENNPTDFKIDPSRVIDLVPISRKSTPVTVSETPGKTQGPKSQELKVFMERANQRAADYQGSPVKRGVGRLLSDFKNATMSGSPGQADFEVVDSQVVDSEVVSSQVVSQPSAPLQQSQVGQVAKSSIAVPVAGAKALTRYGSKRLLGKVINQTVDKIAAAAPPVLIAKKFLENVAKFIPKEIKEKVKNLLSKGIVLFLTYKVATLGGLFGGLIGAVYGYSVLGIPGIFIGFAGGFTGGFLGANALLSSMSGLGTVFSSWQAAAASLSAAPAGLLGFFIGTAGPPVIAVGAVGIGTLFVVITTAAAFFVPSDESHEHAKETVLAVEKTANPDALPNYDFNSETPTSITYTVTINAGANPIEIRSITDKVECQKDGPCKDANGREIPAQDITIDKPTSPIEAGGTYTRSYPIEIVGIAYKDSLLVNTVTVVAYDPSTQKEQTEVASFAIPINNPPAQQPYGFPIAGKINSLDGLFGNPPSRTKKHSSYFRVGLNPARSVIGGIDIGATGAVLSTSGGEVIMAEWFGPGQGCNSTGGTVYVKSGPYIVAYLHLDPSVVSLQGKTVFRGMKLGNVYPGELDPCTSTGAHVHYQIALTSGGNVNFMNPSNAGACTAGKIEPGVPELGKQIPTDWVAPACVGNIGLPSL